MATNVITIPIKTGQKIGGVVVLDLKEYKKFLKYELEREYIDTIVKEGLREEKDGKTETFANFLKREYPRLYEDYKD